MSIKRTYWTKQEIDILYTGYSYAPQPQLNL